MTLAMDWRKAISDWSPSKMRILPPVRIFVHDKAAVSKQSRGMKRSERRRMWTVNSVEGPQLHAQSQFLAAATESCGTGSFSSFAHLPQTAGSHGILR